MGTSCKFQKGVFGGVEQLAQPALVRSVQILNNGIASLKQVEITAKKSATYFAGSFSSI